MKATRRPHLRFRLCLLVAPFVCCGLGCDESHQVRMEGRNFSFSNYGYWGKDLDQLYEEFKTNPCVENKIAAIEAIRYSPLHLEDTEEYHKKSVELLYDSAIYARANWSDEAINICESPRQNLVTKMVEANASLGEAMQDQVIFNLKSIAERANHQNVSNHARALLLKLEPEDKTSWLYSRWKFRVDTMESPIDKEPADANRPYPLNV